jgi:stress response protein SCP2
MTREIKKLNVDATKGDGIKRFELPIKKGDTFRIELSWQSEQDLDGHAAMTDDSTGRPLIYDPSEEVLSAFCVKRRIGRNNTTGFYDKNYDGSFQIPCGALHHSGDARSGSDDGADEVITVDTSRLPDYITVIPIFVTIYDEKNPESLFTDLKNAKLSIYKGSELLVSYELEGQLSKYNAVKFGEIVISDEGWQFNEDIEGFITDFNGLIAMYQQV